MAVFLIALVAFIASLLTFFSGFGLGTLLSPVLAIFFSIPIAIAITAVVHLLNNLFKLFLMYPHIEWSVFLRFSIPAALSAYLGAVLLFSLQSLPFIISYQLDERTYNITPLKLVIGSLFLIFSFSEFSKRLKSLSIPPNYLSVGGLISGFFGGLSGNQGAFRSAFLLKAGLSKESFIATGVASACLVDLVRITVYWFSQSNLKMLSDIDTLLTILIATVAAFSGALLGKFFLKKITIALIEKAVAALMALIGLGFISGFL